MKKSLTAALSMLLCLFFLAPAHADPSVKIADPDVTEMGGIATDSANGLYWSVNSTKTPGKLQAIMPDGSAASPLSYDGEPKAAEALSMIDNTIYVGDIGDPDKNRDSITVFQLTGSLTPGATATTARWTLRYPDGPHDAKAFAVSPRGNIYVVTFDAPGGVYFAQNPAPGNGDVSLTRVADAPNYVTDAVFLHDLTLAVRTYNSVQVLDALGDYQPLRASTLPEQPAGEAISLDGNGQLVLGSKGENSELKWAPLPTSLEQIPDALATAPGATEQSQSPTPSTEETPELTPSATPAPKIKRDRIRSTTTFICLGLGILVAIGAGFFVYRRTTKASDREYEKE